MFNFSQSSLPGQKIFQIQFSIYPIGVNSQFPSFFFLAFQHSSPQSLIKILTPNLFTHSKYAPLFAISIFQKSSGTQIVPMHGCLPSATNPLFLTTALSAISSNLSSHPVSNTSLFNILKFKYKLNYLYLHTLVITIT